MTWSRLVVSTLCTLLAATSALAEIGVGSTYEQVIAEKGRPASKVGSGKIQHLNYPDCTLKLEDGVVKSIRASGKQVAAHPAPASPTPTAAPTRAATPPAEPAAWQTNYAAALAQAKAENRRVFLFFTGSDWCGWCHRLNDEILSTPEFARYSREKLVLVELDFPKRRELPAALRAQNAQLAKRYRIQGYPTVVVLDADGKQVGELGYQEGGPTPFLAALGRF